jgi:hypothetical protein
MNKGVIQPKVETTNWIAGEETGIKYQEVNLSGDWTQFLPTRESQYITSFDSSACVSFSALNCIETQLNYLMDNGKIPEEKLQKLRYWGFIENGKFNFSDRFIAKLSGTTPQGNTLQKVWDAIRLYGLVPEEKWKNEGLSWAEYYQEIPQQIKDFGLLFKSIFDIKYEWVVMGNCNAPNLEWLKYQLKQSPLQTAHPLCVRDNNNVFQTCGSCITQHATTIYNVNDLIRDFDHYYPYLNDYALNYTEPWIMKAVVTLKENQVPQPVFSHIFNIDMQYSQTNNEIWQLQTAYNLLGYKTPVTGYYGNITKGITKDFMIKYNVGSWYEKYISPAGNRVGPKIRAKLNFLLDK